MKQVLVFCVFSLLISGGYGERKSKKDEDTSLFKLLSSESVNKQITKAKSTPDNSDDADLTLTKTPTDEASSATTSGAKDSLQDILSRIQVQNNKNPLIIKEEDANNAGQSNNLADKLPQNEAPNAASNPDLEDPSSPHITISPALNAKLLDSKIDIKPASTALVFGGALLANDSIKNLKEDVSKLSSNEAANLAITKAVLSQTGKTEGNLFTPMVTANPYSEFKNEQNSIPSKTLVQNVEKIGEQQNTEQPISTISGVNTLYGVTTLPGGTAPSGGTQVSSVTLSPNENPTVQFNEVSSNAVSKLVPNGYNIQDASAPTGDLTKFYSKDNFQRLTGKPGQQLTLHFQTSEETEAKKREQERHEATVLSNPKPKTEDNQSENIDIKLLKAFANKKGKLKAMENLAAIEEKVLLGNSKEEVKSSSFVKLVGNGAKNNEYGTNVDNGSIDPTGDSPPQSPNVIPEENSNISPAINSTYEKYPIIIINADENERHKLDFGGEDGTLTSINSLKEKAVPFMPVNSAKMSQAESDELSEEEMLNRKLSYLKDKLRQRKVLNRMHEMKLAELESKLHPADLPAKMINEIPTSSLNEGPPVQQQTAEQVSSSDGNMPAVSPISGTTSAEVAEKQQTFSPESPSSFTSSGEIPLVISDGSSKNLTDAGSNRGTMAHSAPAPQTMFSFSYDPKSPFGPPSWQLLNPEWTCRGRKQSPINIETDRVANEQIVKNVIVKMYPPNQPITGILKNNGHAPTLSLSTEVAVKLFGGTLSNDYYLRQLHFHFGCDSSSGSEHRVNGINFPLELHLVFWDNTTYATFTEAAKSDRGIAVISVLYQLANVALPDVKKTPLSQFSQLLRHVEEEGDNVTVTSDFNFRLERAIPNVISAERADKVYTYEGSLTTPGCYESVTWIVYATHPPVTEGQLRIFRDLKSSKVNSEGLMCNNSRPIQNKNGRRIYTNIVM